MLRTLIALACLPFCFSYPSLFIKPPYDNPKFTNASLPASVPTCLEHPSKGYGDHQAPENDTMTTVTLSSQSDTAAAAVESLCFGSSYNVQVAFPSDSNRYALITSTGAELQPSSEFYNDTKCAGKRFIPSIRPKPSGFKTVLFVPCNSSANSTTLKLTSVESEDGAFMQWSMLYSIEKCGTGPCVDTVPIYPPPPAAPSNSTSPPAKNGTGSSDATKQAAGLLTVVLGMAGLLAL